MILASFWNAALTILEVGDTDIRIPLYMFWGPIVLILIGCLFAFIADLIDG